MSIAWRHRFFGTHRFAWSLPILWDLAPYWATPRAPTPTSTT
jgi:hypothetical protein